MKAQVHVYGQPVTVEVADRIQFATPLTDAEARQSIALELAPRLAAQLESVPATKKITRDEDGRITGMIDRPAVDRISLAAGLAWEVAGVVLDGAVE